MTRFVVFGAGAIGGVVGARMAQSGHDVALVARGAHAEAIAARGLRVDDPDGSTSVRIPVTDDAASLDLGPADVVLVAVKGQDTPGALEALAPAGPDLAVVCLQNGVSNEPAMLRLFRHVYAVPVMCPATHLEPGVVQANSAPTTGILDVGCYPAGVDDRCDELAAAFRASTFESVARADIMRWKWRKLLMNLGNAVEAASGRAHGNGVILEAIWKEADAVLAAAGVEVASAEEDRERRGDHITIRPVGEGERPGGSSWQSLARGAGRIETDLFNGEIVLLGRLHGIPTPVNEAVQRIARGLARTGAPPASMSPAELAAAVWP
jgi:2-dehydropantoate 2-reductase